MVISIDVEKTFRQNSIPIYDKTLQKIGIEEPISIIKAIQDKSKANILNGEELKAFPQDQEQDKCSTLTSISQYCFGSPTHGNQKRKRKEFRLEKK